MYTNWKNKKHELRVEQKREKKEKPGSVSNDI